MPDTKEPEFSEWKIQPETDGNQASGRGETEIFSQLSRSERIHYFNDTLRPVFSEVLTPKDIISDYVRALVSSRHHR